MTIQCTLICHSSAEHLNQIFTGFGLLEKSGILSLKLEKDKAFWPSTHGRPALKAVFDGNLKVVYDTFDGKRLYEEDLNWCDFYFKRSFNPDSIQLSGSARKIYPLGFNYAVYGPNLHSLQRLIFSLLSLRTQKQFQNFPLLVLRNSKLLTRLLNLNSGVIASIEMFEGLPRVDLPPRIIFFAQVWDPSTTQTDSRDECEQINQMRADCIRALRKEFKQMFLGGIEYSNFAARTFKDVVVASPKMTRKKVYSNLLRGASIGIATAGLHQSNGWKMGEYVAGAKAIVCERLHYQVPGDFLPGKNYLEFTTPDECVERAAELVQNHAKRCEMMENNFTYYHRYLRPDRLIWNTYTLAARLGQPCEDKSEVFQKV